MSSRTLSSRTCTIVLGGLLLTAAARPLCAQPYFTGTGTLSGGRSVIAQDISPDGRVVLGDTGIFDKKVALWTLADGLRSIMPNQIADTTGGISHLGRVVAGGFPGNGTRHGFRWTEETGAISVGDLPGGEFRSTVQGVSPRGDILVGSSNSERSSEGSGETYRWTAETGMVALGDLPGGLFRSGASAISADELVIVGGGRSEQGLEAYRWVEETGMVGLGYIPGGYPESTALAVSADGSVVVGNGYDATHQRAFRWTEQAGMVALEKIHPDQIFQRVGGVSWDGDVIVGEVGVGEVGFGPFYWTPEGNTRWLADVLDEHGIETHHGWYLYKASAVSADGRTIVGWGINPDGDGEGWVAYLGPACRADFDDDGEVDVEDVAAYLAAWLESNIFADWNYDGSINTRDLLGFLNEWVAKPGCE
ncbi:MAG: GC-type dockerin domain-anchored protein [Planctomycetota bacterium]|nr:GC-type dockerin domain-anchored protein [Planctomycetota bacterium]